MAMKSCDKNQDTGRRLQKFPSYSDKLHQHLQTQDTAWAQTRVSQFHTARVTLGLLCSLPLQFYQQ